MPDGSFSIKDIGETIVKMLSLMPDENIEIQRDRMRFVWVEAHQLKDADPVTVRFNGNITIEATKTKRQGDRP